MDQHDVQIKNLEAEIANLRLVVRDLTDVAETTKALTTCKTPSGEKVADLFEVPDEYEQFVAEINKALEKAYEARNG